MMVNPPPKGDARSLPKRFYRQARAAAVDMPTGGPAFRIELDGRPLRTPAKSELQVPTQSIADAVADEWNAQGDTINPSVMPLTRIANSTIDGVVARRVDVEAEIARYAMNDLLYYRADQPEALVRQQAEAWDPMLAWAQSKVGTPLRTGTGIGHVAQPAALEVEVAKILQMRQPIEIAALHVITTLTGSALMALALCEGAAPAEAVWAAAHVDEDFQISQWGWDAEAEARRKARAVDFFAASRILQLTSDS